MIKRTTSMAAVGIVTLATATAWGASHSYDFSESHWAPSTSFFQSTGQWPLVIKNQTGNDMTIGQSAFTGDFSNISGDSLSGHLTYGDEYVGFRFYDPTTGQGQIMQTMALDYGQTQPDFVSPVFTAIDSHGVQSDPLTAPVSTASSFVRAQGSLVLDVSDFSAGGAALSDFAELRMASSSPSQYHTYLVDNVALTESTATPGNGSGDGDGDGSGGGGDDDPPPPSSDLGWDSSDLVYRQLEGLPQTTATPQLTNAGPDDGSFTLTETVEGADIEIPSPGPHNLAAGDSTEADIAVGWIGTSSGHYHAEITIDSDTDNALANNALDVDLYVYSEPDAGPDAGYAGDSYATPDLNVEGAQDGPYAATYHGAPTQLILRNHADDSPLQASMKVTSLGILQNGEQVSASEKYFTSVGDTNFYPNWYVGSIIEPGSFRGNRHDHGVVFVRRDGMLAGEYREQWVVTVEPITAAGLAIEGNWQFEQTFNLVHELSSSTGGGTQQLSSGMLYTGWGSSSDEGSDTEVELLGGEAGGDRTLGIDFLDNVDRPAFSAGAVGDPVGDAVEVTGIDGDLFAIAMDYSAADLSAAGITDESLMRLFWYDELDSNWKLAVDGNTTVGSEAGFYTESYLSALGGATLGTEHLGMHGLDTANNRVWAVLDHNSIYSIGGLAPSVPAGASIPEPALLSFMALAGAVLFPRRHH